MAKEDEYRAHAAECQRMAHRAAKEADKVQWLKLAQSWLTLLDHEHERVERTDAPRVVLQQQQPQKSGR